MFADDFAEHATIVGGDGKVAALVQLVFFESGPLGVNPPAFYVSAHDEHAICMTMIGATIAVFMRGAAKFRHADEDDLAHAVAHVLVERSDSLPQVFQQVGELALDATFVDVIVPPSAIEESNFQADIGLE